MFWKVISNVEVKPEKGTCSYRIQRETTMQGRWWDFSCCTCFLPLYVWKLLIPRHRIEIEVSFVVASGEVGFFFDSLLIVVK